MIGLFKRRKASLDRLMRHVGAETARQAALDALQAARAKGDTRAIHAATEALRDATHALMRVELRLD
ncbi:MAG: hypothetical protein EBS68_12030 [Rhodobacteraceae bacterium]|nr:hypothetical protein [Paracoccaceae bacterium]